MMYQPLRYYEAPQQRRSLSPACVCCFALLAISFCAIGFTLILRGHNFSFAQLSAVMDQAEASLAFQEFVSEHGKEYASPEEQKRRFEIFADNYRRINEFNEKNSPRLTVGVNQFADLTDEEFEREYLQAGSAPPQCTVTQEQRAVLKPEGRRAQLDVNWVKQGKVLPVKDQGRCGSCWTFAATSVTETLYAIRENPQPLVRLAEQQLVDCCRASRTSICFSGNGCSGGIVGQALDYVRANGQTKSTEYPYTAKNGVCKEKDVTPVFKLDGYANITAGDVDSMEKAILTRSVAVGVAAGYFGFRFYKSGIVTEGCADTPINHGVTIVGAGAENGVDYWLVRNSWGGNWGASGYLKIARKRGSGMGVCGITSCPQYPLYKEPKAHN